MFQHTELMCEADVRDGSVVKGLGCSSRGPGFDSQYPHGGSQLSVTPFLRDPWPLLASTGTKWYMDVHAGSYTLKKKKKEKKTRRRIDTRDGCGDGRAGDSHWIKAHVSKYHSPPP